MRFSGPELKFYVFMTLVGGIVIAEEADEFPKVFDSEKGTGLISAEEAAAGFEVPEGVTVRVFAKEPMVRNPIGMDWDERGRMWVAENYTYAERTVRFEEKLRDRVIILEDKDGDGQADQRKVFWDEGKRLTSVALDHDGVWVMCPPQLLFIPDRDRDDVPDGVAEVKLDGFTVAKRNYHNFANGLKWGPDGWLYGRCGHSCPGLLGVPGCRAEERVPMDGGIWRFHPQRKVVEVLTHGTTNPWGHDWDENGELFFINTVNGHLWHMIPGAHFKEPFGPSKNPLIYDRLEMHADHWHFDTGAHWTKSRNGKANDFGGGHAHIGMTIYQAEQFPEEWRGKLLTWNMHGRRMNRERLERRGSGYVGRHEPDQFLAKDQWFRGLEISTGPEGSIYGLDWSDTGECHDSTGVHRTSGRIYRFSYGEAKRGELGRKLADLEGVIKDGNVWYFRQVMRLMRRTQDDFHRGGAEVAGETRRILENFERDGTRRERLRALWMLRGSGIWGDEKLVGLLEDEDEFIRLWAFRFLSDEMGLDTLDGKRPVSLGKNSKNLDRVVRVMNEWAEHESPLLRLEVASRLQRIPLGRRAEVAEKLVQHAGDADDHNLPYLVWFGIHGLREARPEDLVEVAEATEWPLLLRWISRGLGEGHIKLREILKVAQNNPKKAQGILQGLAEGYRGQVTAEKPEGWDEVEEQLGKIDELEDLISDLAILYGDGRSLDLLKEHVLDRATPLSARRTGLETLIAREHGDLREICEELLGDRQLNDLAVQGLGRVDDGGIGKVILGHYHRSFRKEQRAEVVSVLVTRKPWTEALLTEMEAGRIPRADLSTYQARQIVALDDAGLTARLNKVWGSLRSTPELKRKQIDGLKKILTAGSLAKADQAAGEKIFTMKCAACHVLFGKGGTIGPNLTGSGRKNLDYLLENIVDPSGVVGVDQQLTVLTLKDGRVLSGIVKRETKKAVTLTMLGNEAVIIATDKIATRRTIEQSLMPEGLLDQMKEEEVRDLIGYLMAD